MTYEENRKVIEWIEERLQASRPVFWMDRFPKYVQWLINIAAIILIIVVSVIASAIITIAVHASVNILSAP